MTQKNEPAMPRFTTSGINEKGLTAIEHAALVTSQPVSGTPWLDEMIRAQRRERLAGQALASIVSNSRYKPTNDALFEAGASIELADALIAALEGGAK